MDVKEVKSNLCYYDERNPYMNVDKVTAREVKVKIKDCYCDNCFQGRSFLAEELLKYID